MSHTVARKDISPTDDVDADIAAALNPESQARTPSWFSRDMSDEAGEALADRYRASQKQNAPIFETPGPQAYDDYKRRLEEKFTQAHRLYDPAEKPLISELRPTMPLSDIHGRRRLYEQEQREHMTQHTPKHKSTFSWTRFASLAFTAILLGGGAGYSAANSERISNLLNKSVTAAQATFAELITKATPENPSSNQSTILKKSVATASLDVNDVSGKLNSMIPLMLSAQPSDVTNPLSLKIMGLPQDAYLTAGVETSKGSWLLKPSDIAGVKLVVPQFDSSVLQMEVAAIEDRTGALAAPIKAMNVQLNPANLAIAPPLTQTAAGKSELVNADSEGTTIAPANAPPETAFVKVNEASAIPADLPQASDLISKANGLLNSGDITSARQFYLRANEMGDAKGAFGVGRTYDPLVFAALNVQSLKPDPIKAAEWYKKAIAGGVGAATVALQGLQVAQP
jgi:hypothetical protein